MIQAIFHGHSFVEIFDKSTNHSILIDPYISENPKCELKVEDFLQGEKTFDIVLTHGHNDHLGDTPVLAKKAQNIVATFELANYLKSKSIENVYAMGIGGYHDFEKYGIKFFQALHGGEIADGKSGFVCNAAGVIIYLAGKKIYHAGDTALMLDMQLLAAEKLDLAFLPIGDNYTMDPVDALKAVEFIKSKIIVPIHYDTFPNIRVDSLEFAREVMLSGISTPKLLSPGQAVILE